MNIIFIHFRYLCDSFRVRVRGYRGGEDYLIPIILEMLDKIGTLELYKSEEFTKILCKKISQYNLISEFTASGIPYFYDYVNS